MRVRGWSIWLSVRAEWGMQNIVSQQQLGEGVWWVLPRVEPFQTLTLLPHWPLKPETSQQPHS